MWWMTIIEFIVAIVLLLAVVVGVNSFAAVPAATKRIVNLVVGVVIAIVAIVFLLSFLGVNLHRRI